eukprot:Nitzschia sp. Nitz4//scaffold8_size234185//122120//123455//NITZ4_001267-RA/size234185-augustus-gene-0.268-mRNA-1//-1//CDS//3329559836//9291//frame0
MATTTLSGLPLIHHANAAMPKGSFPSCFDVTNLPSNSIQKRELHSFSVHYSVSTSQWIATIARPFDETRRTARLTFASEKEARVYAKAFSPPKMVSNAVQCACCSAMFNAKCQAINCRNCGSQICDNCSTRWGVRMVPRTYVRNLTALTVRVCKSCDWLSNAFCLSLLRGNYSDAVLLNDTGNVNLHCTFADISKEAMFPIHCAVMGGNLRLVKWLVEQNRCPVTLRRDHKTGMILSVQTSSGRTLMDLAMTGKSKTDILRYLVKKGLSLYDTKDAALAAKTLQRLLGTGFETDAPIPVSVIESSDHFSVATLEDACIICCEKQMDCVLTPCGHQMCCSGCGSQLQECPVCKKPCSTLKVYRL